MFRKRQWVQGGVVAVGARVGERIAARRLSRREGVVRKLKPWFVEDRALAF
jgi:hypothetical protein